MTIELESIIDGHWTSNGKDKIFISKTRLDYPIRHGKVLIKRKPSFHPFFPEFNNKNNSAISADRFIFLDIETTNISAGSSCYVFLIGLCWFDPYGLSIGQIFIDDFSNEALLLTHLEDVLNQFDLLFTYNGKSFDIPVLRTRLIMNHMADIFYKKDHIDLLNLSRYLFKRRLSSCQLSNIEQYILRFERTNEDLPGWLIPQIYFDYLENGHVESLKSIFYHNKFDIVSLAALAVHVDFLLKSDPKNIKFFPEDLLGLADYALRLKNYILAERYYQDYYLKRSLSDKNEVSNLEKYGYLLKKLNRIPDGKKIWEHAAQNGSINACIELAKYYEHKEKNFETALNYVQKAQSIHEKKLMSESYLKDFQKRYQRLISKIERSKL